MLSKINEFIRYAAAWFWLRIIVLVGRTGDFIIATVRFIKSYLRGAALVGFGLGLGIVTGVPVGGAGMLYLIHQHGPEIGQYAMDYGVRLLSMTQQGALRWEVYSAGDEAVNDPKMRFAAPLAKRDDGTIKKAEMAPSDTPYPSDIARNEPAPAGRGKKKR